MRWFVSKPAEAAARPALVRPVAQWNGGEWPRSYEAQVRDAYLGNPIAQRAVRIVAEGTASVPFYAGAECDGGVAELLRRPGLIETIATQIVLQGNAYVRIVGDADGAPAKLFALRPEHVTIEATADGWPATYLYRAGETVIRLAGTVIWATDLREDTHRSGGGKGGAKTTTYSYSASFAVALSARPIRDVGRIWADGKLLRTSTGEYKSETGFRLHRGDEGQDIDPLIASAEGIASTPAHRGLAYAVFENLQLADYGNRIPSLTFEVIADDAPVAVRAIAAELSDGAITGGGGAAVAGFAATGDSARGAIEALAGAYPLPIVDDGVTLRFDDGVATAIDVDLLGAAASGTAPRERRTRRAAGALPDEIAIGYYEPARDYQAGLQRARRDGVAVRAARIELAAALAAGEAKGLAEAALARAWIARETTAITLPWRYAAIGAGRGVLLDGAVWRVRERAIEHDVVKLDLERDGPGPIAATAAGGRATTAGDAAAGATVLALLDLPALDDGDAATQLVWLAAAGTAPGWRRAEASLSFDGGASWTGVGSTAAPAVIGDVSGALGDGPRELFDRRNAIEVELLHEGIALAGADEAALAAGANLAAIGSELLQFGSARQLSARRWQLSDLLRGRRGTDGAIATHAAGERFVLIEPAALRALDVPIGRMGGELRVSATGPGDAGVAAIASITVVGRAVRPLAPIALDAIRREDGTIRFGWIRRSRLGWAWLDGIDAPLGEDREAYRLTIAPAGAAARTIECAEPGWDYPPGLQAAAAGRSRRRSRSSARAPRRRRRRRLDLLKEMTMTEHTPRFALPLLQAGQAQKEATHNEAIVALEMIAQPIVETIGDNAPPASPVEGRSWIVGTAPSGAWAGRADALASWTAGGWRFVAAVEGMAATVRASGLPARRGASAWSIGDVVAGRLTIGGVQVIGARQPAIAAPSGGTTTDTAARSAIGAILSALRSHGLIEP